MKQQQKSETEMNPFKLSLKLLKYFETLLLIHSVMNYINHVTIASNCEIREKFF